MKPGMQIKTIGAACWMLGALPLAGANLVVSGLGEASEDRVVFRDAAGVLLAEGSRVQAFDFGDLDEASLQAQIGLAGWPAEQQAFGEAAAIGTGSGSIDGSLEAVFAEALGEEIERLHLVVWNAADPADATEWLVLRLDVVLPPDDLGGLPGYAATHLKDAQVVFGASTADGFATAGVASGFATWIAEAMPEGTPAADLAPEADPDRDGAENLLEYAMGSLPGDPASQPMLVASGAGAFRFPLRDHDEALEISVESSVDLGGTAWWPVDGVAFESVAGPHPAPAGCSWRQVTVPNAGARNFIRLRATTRNR